MDRNSESLKYTKTLLVEHKDYETKFLLFIIYCFFCIMCDASGVA